MQDDPGSIEPDVLIDILISDATVDFDLVTACQRGNSSRVGRKAIEGSGNGIPSDQVPCLREAYRDTDGRRASSCHRCACCDYFGFNRGVALGGDRDRRVRNHVAALLDTGLGQAQDSVFCQRSTGADGHPYRSANS